MLLNLLIAIVSNAFDNQMAQTIITKYKFRCEISFEALVLKGLVGSKMKRANIFSLSCQQVTDTKLNEGIVKPIKDYISQQNKDLSEMMMKIKKEILFANMDKNDNIRAKISNIEYKMGSLEESIN
jgi:hypothetical protein